MNKILLLIESPKERTEFEESLYEFVEAGAELFIASNKGQALAILEREKPHLTFIDEAFITPNEPLLAKHKVVVLSSQERKGPDCLLRPFTPQSILEKCVSFLPLPKKTESILPM